MFNLIKNKQAEVMQNLSLERFAAMCVFVAEKRLVWESGDGAQETQKKGNDSVEKKHDYLDNLLNRYNMIGTQLETDFTKEQKERIEAKQILKNLAITKEKPSEPIGKVGTLDLTGLKHTSTLVEVARMAQEKRSVVLQQIADFMQDNPKVVTIENVKLDEFFKWKDSRLFPWLGREGSALGQKATKGAAEVAKAPFIWTGEAFKWLSEAVGLTEIFEKYKVPLADYLNGKAGAVFPVDFKKEIEDKTRVAVMQSIMDYCDKNGIKYKVEAGAGKDGLRIIFSGGDAKQVEKIQNQLGFSAVDGQPHNRENAGRFVEAWAGMGKGEAREKTIDGFRDPDNARGTVINLENVSQKRMDELYAEYQKLPKSSPEASQISTLAADKNELQKLKAEVKQLEDPKYIPSAVEERVLQENPDLKTKKAELEKSKGKFEGSAIQEVEQRFNALNDEFAPLLSDAQARIIKDQYEGTKPSWYYDLIGGTPGQKAQNEIYKLERQKKLLQGVVSDLVTMPEEEYKQKISVLREIPQISAVESQIVEARVQYQGRIKAKADFTKAKQDYDTLFKEKAQGKIAGYKQQNQERIQALEGKIKTGTAEARYQQLQNLFEETPLGVAYVRLRETNQGGAQFEAMLKNVKDDIKGRNAAIESGKEAQEVLKKVVGMENNSVDFSDLPGWMKLAAIGFAGYFSFKHTGWAAAILGAEMLTRMNVNEEGLLGLLDDAKKMALDKMADKAQNLEFNPKSQREALAITLAGETTGQDLFDYIETKGGAEILKDGKLANDKESEKFAEILQKIREDKVKGGPEVVGSLRQKGINAQVFHSGIVSLLTYLGNGDIQKGYQKLAEGRNANLTVSELVYNAGREYKTGEKNYHDKNAETFNREEYARRYKGEILAWIKENQGEILFDYNKSSVDSFKGKEKEKLDQLAKFLKEYDKYKTYPFMLVLEGYADPVASEAYNTNLSQKRAQAIYDYLTTTGKVSKNILLPIGYGEKNVVNPDTHALSPIPTAVPSPAQAVQAGEQTESWRKYSRRVLFRFEGYEPPAMTGARPKLPQSVEDAGEAIGNFAGARANEFWKWVVEQNAPKWFKDIKWEAVKEGVKGSWEVAKGTMMEILRKADGTIIIKTIKEEGGKIIEKAKDLGKVSIEYALGAIGIYSFQQELGLKNVAEEKSLNEVDQKAIKEKVEKKIKEIDAVFDQVVEGNTLSGIMENAPADYNNWTLGLPELWDKIWSGEGPVREKQWLTTIQMKKLEMAQMYQDMLVNAKKSGKDYNESDQRMTEILTNLKGEIEKLIKDINNKIEGSWSNLYNLGGGKIDAGEYQTFFNRLLPLGYQNQEYRDHIVALHGLIDSHNQTDYVGRDRSTGAYLCKLSILWEFQKRTASIGAKKGEERHRFWPDTPSEVTDDQKIYMTYLHKGIEQSVGEMMKDDWLDSKIYYPEIRERLGKNLLDYDAWIDAGKPSAVTAPALAPAGAPAVAAVPTGGPTAAPVLTVTPENIETKIKGIAVQIFEAAKKRVKDKDKKDNLDSAGNFYLENGLIKLGNSSSTDKQFSPDEFGYATLDEPNRERLEVVLNQLKKGKEIKNIKMEEEVIKEKKEKELRATIDALATSCVIGPSDASGNLDLTGDGSVTVNISNAEIISTAIPGRKIKSTKDFEDYLNENKVADKGLNKQALKIIETILVLKDKEKK